MPHSEDFKKLWGSMKEQYLGKSVPKEYQKKYGKRYDKEEVKSIAYATAKKLGIKIDK